MKTIRAISTNCLATDSDFNLWFAFCPSGMDFYLVFILYGELSMIICEFTISE